MTPPAGDTLVDSKTPTFVIVPRDAVYERSVQHLVDVKARKGLVLGIATEGDKNLWDRADDLIAVPGTADPFYPLLTIVALHLFAYHIAVALGQPVDRPRHIADRKNT